MSEEVIEVALEKVHVDLLDFFIPFLGKDRSEVAKNLIIRSIERDIANPAFERIRGYSDAKVKK